MIFARWRNVPSPRSGCVLLAGNGAQAEDVYKIGMSAGLTGYAATVDRAWRDGVEVAVDALNAKGGILGRKVQVIVEDNRSEPQEAVTAYRKMISSDNVNVFASGCVSAGNFAAAPLVMKAETPMVLCSILPQQPDQVSLGVHDHSAAPFRSRDPARLSQEQDHDQKDRRPARSLALRQCAKRGGGEGSRRLWPRDRRQRAIQDRRRRSERADPEDVSAPARAPSSRSGSAAPR